MQPPDNGLLIMQRQIHIIIIDGKKKELSEKGKKTKKLKATNANNQTMIKISERILNFDLLHLHIVRNCADDMLKKSYCKK